jgi:MFS transporter, putative metabolite:H+ symporter
MATQGTPDEKLTGYHWRLLIFLSVATFFEGYDFLALAQILPQLAEEMDLSKSGVGYLNAFVNAGAVAAFVLVRKADRWGRRRVLTITIAGYTIFTLLSGFATNVWFFAPLQFMARFFLIAEWATSMVYAAEEFPPAKRATIIGVIQGFSSLGGIVCAGVVPLLLDTAYGWRTVYFVGVVPLVLLAFARRNLKETKRFEELKARGNQTKQSFYRIWRGPYRSRLLIVALVWGLTYACTQNVITFWKLFAMEERGFTNADVGLAISIAAVAAMPLVFAAGKLLDVLGRHKGAILIFTVTAIATVAAYTLEEKWALTVALVGGIFGVSGVLPVLNAYTNELFPTDLRGDAYAWSNNLLGRIGYVGGPALVGVLAERLGGYGVAVSATAVFLVAAVIVIVTMLPETKGKGLEETAAI